MPTHTSTYKMSDDAPHMAGCKSWWGSECSCRGDAAVPTWDPDAVEAVEDALDSWDSAPYDEAALRRGDRARHALDAAVASGALVPRVRVQELLNAAAIWLREDDAARVDGGDAEAIDAAKAVVRAVVADLTETAAQDASAGPGPQVSTPVPGDAQGAAERGLRG